MKYNRLTYTILKDLKEHPGSFANDIVRINNQVFRTSLTKAIRSKLYWLYKQGFVCDFVYGNTIRGYALTPQGEELLQSYAKS